MTSFRSVLFWLHLTAGVLAGLVVLVMSTTGVALTYEKQVLEWSDSGYQSALRAEGTRRLTPSELVQAAVRYQPDLEPTGVTLRGAADAPASVSAGRDQLYLDAYSGLVLGEPNPCGVRVFMAAMRSLHPWLSVEGPSRPTARAVTGWSNVLFLFLVVSGMYLWLPRVWNRASVAAVALFKRSHGTSKARDFNWHNVIGIWSAVPLFIVVLSAVPISFPWASDLVYRAVGARTTRRGRRCRGAGGQPQLRSTMTFDREGGLVSTETFGDQSLGRRIRSVMRFAHTGEVLGLTGQTVAGLVSAGAVVMVWTGLALSWRRFRAWITRPSRARAAAPVVSTPAIAPRAAAVVAEQSLP